MEFGLFYEIPVAAALDARSERDALPRRDRAGGARRGGGLHALLDRRAPLPRRVLALLGARGAVRRDRGAHQTHQDRPRRAAAAVSVQPSAPRRRDGRRRSTASATAGSSSAPAARRRAPSSRASASTRRHARHVGGGARGRRRRLDERRLRVARPRLQGAAAARASEADPEAASAAVDGDDQPGRATSIAGRHGLGLLSFTIGVPPEELPARIGLYRDGLDGGEAGRQVRQPARRHLHDGALRGDQRGGAAERRRVGASGTSARASS